MNASIDINQDLFEQFEDQLSAVANKDRLQLPSKLGSGGINRKVFPGKVELFHFKFQLQEAFQMHSVNPESSEWWLLNINLSKAPVDKPMDNDALHLQRFLPSGMLLYTPKTDVSCATPPHTDFEFVLLRFPKAWLAYYSHESLEDLQETLGAIIYEDLDAESENLLRQAIHPGEEHLLSHARVLEFLNRLLLKLKQREVQTKYERLFPEDLKGLFMAAALLRNPNVTETPSIEGLSQTAGMGATKFKTSFKQLFGAAPVQYHQKIKVKSSQED